MSRPRKPTRRYNREKLIEIGKDRGFHSTEDFYMFLMAHIGYNKGVSFFRVKMAREQFTWSQIKLIANCLMMSDRELIDTFFPDTFTIETPGGQKYACLEKQAREELRLHYDRPGRYIRHRGGGKPPKETMEDRQREIEKVLDAILEQEKGDKTNGNL